VDAGAAGGPERGASARVQDGVLADERAVEIACERRYLRRKARRKDYLTVLM
jgi:hypothetical protein